MGKSKKRIINSSKNLQQTDISITREKAIKIVSEELTTDVKSKNAINLISMFGLSADELAEAGVEYEVLKALGSLIN